MVGEIKRRGNVRVENFTVKASEDIEKGEIVVNDGAGIIAATSSTKGPYFMALAAHDYSEVSVHSLGCLVEGVGNVQALPAAAIVQGRWVEMSTTAGAVTIFDYSGPGDWFDVVGMAMEAAATTATDCKVLFGAGTS